MSSACEALGHSEHKSSPLVVTLLMQSALIPLFFYRIIVKLTRLDFSYIYELIVTIIYEFVVAADFFPVVIKLHTLDCMLFVVLLCCSW